MAWTRPFDGGFEQTLELQMVWGNQQVLRPLSVTLTRYNITGLLPFTNYTLRLRGVNQMGPGAFSRRVRHPTPSEPLLFDFSCKFCATCTAVLLISSMIL